MSTDAMTVAAAVERLGLPAQSVIDLAMVGKLVTAPSASPSDSDLEVTMESVERYRHRLGLIRDDALGVAPPSAGVRPRCRDHVAWTAESPTMTGAAHAAAQQGGWS